MNTPPLHDRLNRLVSFAHPRNQPPLTNREIADKASTLLDAPVDEDLIVALRDGSVTVLTDDLREVLGQIFGLTDLGYLKTPRCVAENNQILLMHDRLALISEARDLGVQHIEWVPLKRTTFRPYLLSIQLQNSSTVHGGMTGISASTCSTSPGWESRRAFQESNTRIVYLTTRIDLQPAV
ncbi:hypothetical protein GKZ92_23510 (plasmid) [Gordonia sp. 135]|uniref:hypothetical protein n=1 Tax=Gordonia sp. 135 TaxID=2676309 RepID=UPI0012BB216F|nr:hypothetical protein [Gordonia sp. 135]QGP90677.1 hypothetical protein GKZ92_23510 [Gordonia sp. 135]